MATIQIDRLLDACIRMGGSDIHIVVGRPPTLRISGSLKSLDTKVLDSEDTTALMKSITPEKNQQQLQEDGSCDFGFAFGDYGRFRVAVFRQKSNISMVLRLIPSKFLSFDQIGLPGPTASLCRRPRGLFLVTGPTGSGKTTTLASMINYINENLDTHIITVEEPIEYYHDHKRAVINQREVGLDVPTFAEALKRSLRQDPDVILVGELRDLDTIEAAISAAETGHLVFGTLHTTGCQGTVNRIIDAFPTNQQEMIRVQLSTNLIAVLSQTLCPVKNAKGRVAAYEFMLVTPAISNLIRENKTYRIESTIQTCRNLGMRLLDDHLWELYQKGQISLMELVDKSRNPAEMLKKARENFPKDPDHAKMGPIIGEMQALGQT
ncbi:type IV pilus twitching motility protein PilT [Sedimentisphaera salicampi]|uniref:Twitching mobility protein n=1 Tax=Sedimentisphaera salicampi TaxID=1941349 RepID=A0A1W6LPE7_9BACT|nr:type IV pilus twitching motility protein PilT [Sedimentisphaera salicampi]ARN57626.1 Twitching mobility protein [Sedimentisphaera salicampi]OXU14194.1 Twitching mobility protein [Sedimentisphaera salicampi]